MMENTNWGNQTTITEFILLGFEHLPELRIPLFLIFLLVYIMTVAVNITMIYLVVTDRHLWTPMYTFLGNLSCMETCYSSTILPRMLANIFSANKVVTFNGCLTQMFYFCFLGIAECYMLAVMAYDRYLAICKPLHYATLMNARVTIQLAAASWLCPIIIAVVIILSVSGLTFCGPNEINHFFCELSPVVHLSCTDIKWVMGTIFIMSLIDIFPPLLLILISYIFIISTILRIPSVKGKQKAFSTCSSHLTVVILFYGSLIMVYILPQTDTLQDLNKIFSLFYTVVTPLANPIIYSLRNKEVKDSLMRTLAKVKMPIGSSCNSQ